MNREGHCYDPTIHIGDRVKLNPKLWWVRNGYKNAYPVVKIAGIFAYVNLGDRVAAVHMVDCLPCH